MSLAIDHQEDLTMKNAETLDLDRIVAETGDPATREVTTSDFIGFLMARLNYTFETARDVIYLLIELGRAVLTNRYTLRLAE